MKLKFNVGDRVFDKKYGHGVVQRVDAGNSEFPYLNSNVKGIRVSEVRVLHSASIFVCNIYESTPWMRLVYVSSILTARAYNARVAQLVERVIMRLVKPLTANFFWSVKPVVAGSIPAPGST